MQSLILLLIPVIAFAQWVPEQENPGLFEGDIVLSPEQKQAIDQGNNGYATRKTKLWPKTGKYVVVPYQFASGLPSESKTAVEDAAREYKDKIGCIILQPRRSENAYIEFYPGGGCSSPVGRTGGRNRISLPKGCLRKGTVLHEIAHSLGVYHEQSRPDRDDKVSIQWDNISPGAKHNFQKRTYSEIDSLGTTYDYYSIMHYSKTAFGRGRITIKTNDPTKQNVIGQRSGFSTTDIIQLKRLYCNGAGPIPTRGPPIPTQGPTGCKDIVSDCSKYRSYCNNPPNREWKTYLERNCRKSCNIC